MGYNDVMYLAIFLPVTAVIYRLIPKKYRPAALTASSWLYFYLSSQELIIYLIAATVWVYGIALLIGKSQSPKVRKAWLTAGLTVLFGTLLYVKYTNFFIGTINHVMAGRESFIPLQAQKILVPLGISYYTLEAAGYLLEVYWQRVEPDRNFLRISVFLGFFPQIMEGPIARYQDTAMQFTAGTDIVPDNIVNGCFRILYGMFKKLVIADRLYLVVNEVYSHSGSYHGAVVALAGVCYTLQLYMEFSGMVDVSLGSAQIFGITLPENFRQPFFSQSASEFWRRWHISLGTWLKTYIFYPVTTSKMTMKVNRKVRKKWGKHAAKVVVSFLALTPVWLFNGLWHGPQWNYICYGIYYLVLLMLEVILEPAKNAFYKKTGWDKKSHFFQAFRVLRTWIIIFTGELFFRANSQSQAWSMFKSIFHGFSPAQLLPGNLPDFYIGSADVAAIIVGTAIVLGVDIARERGVHPIAWMRSRRQPLRWALYYGLIFSVIIFGAYGTGYMPVDMIYTQF